MAIITYPLDGVTYNAADAETYLCTRTSGVFFNTGMFPASLSGSREVIIGPGMAWIRNDTFRGKSVLSDEAVAVAIDAADGALDRVDRIVLRFDQVKNASYIVVKKGTPETNAKAPAVEQTPLMYELGLYTVRVRAGSLAIIESDIENTMADETVCGYMRDGVTKEGMSIPGAAEGSLIVTDANGNFVASSVTIEKLGTRARMRMEGTTLYIDTL